MPGPRRPPLPPVFDRHRLAFAYTKARRTVANGQSASRLGTSLIAHPYGSFLDRQRPRSELNAGHPPAVVRIAGGNPCGIADLIDQPAVRSQCGLDNHDNAMHLIIGVRRRFVGNEVRLRSDRGTVGAPLLPLRAGGGARVRYRLVSPDRPTGRLPPAGRRRWRKHRRVGFHVNMVCRAFAMTWSGSLRSTLVELAVRQWVRRAPCRRDEAQHRGAKRLRRCGVSCHPPSARFRIEVGDHDPSIRVSVK